MSSKEIEQALEYLERRGLKVYKYMKRFNLSQEDATEKLNQEDPIPEEIMEFFDVVMPEVLQEMAVEEGLDATKH